MARDWGGAAPDFGGPHGAEPQAHGGLSPRTIAWLVLGSVLAFSALLLIVQNSDKVEMEWLWLDFKAALWVFFLLTLIGGMILGQVLVFFLKRTRQKNREVRRPEHD